MVSGAGRRTCLCVRVWQGGSSQLVTLSVRWGVRLLG